MTSNIFMVGRITSNLFCVKSFYQIFPGLKVGDFSARFRGAWRDFRAVAALRCRSDGTCVSRKYARL
ncbi:hypothetical protein SBV1_2110009 [Verrucomicrobia bacterium]|nr:hypothetical protein SBV1_2110009 [Verrucomicrobiota bacterium]